MGTLKRRSLPFKCLLVMFAAATVCGLMAAKAQAAAYYWDTNGGTAGAGGTPNGTWQANCTDWTTDSTGSSTISARTTQATDDVYFVAGAGTASGNNPYAVTLSGTDSADSLTFQASGPATFTGGFINLGGGSTPGISIPQCAYRLHSPRGRNHLVPDQPPGSSDLDEQFQ